MKRKCPVLTPAGNLLARSLTALFLKRLRIQSRCDPEAAAAALHRRLALGPRRHRGRQRFVLVADSLTGLKEVAAGRFVSDENLDEALGVLKNGDGLNAGGVLEPRNEAGSLSPEIADAGQAPGSLDDRTGRHD